MGSGEKRWQCSVGCVCVCVCVRVLCAVVLCCCFCCSPAATHTITNKITSFFPIPYYRYRPQDRDTNFYMIQVMHLQERFAEAVAIARKAVVLWPSDDQVRTSPIHLPVCSATVRYCIWWVCVHTCYDTLTCLGTNCTHVCNPSSCTVCFL